MAGKYVVFDLDDTLAYEIDYLKSAYRGIATLLEPSEHEKLYKLMVQKYYDKQNVFQYLSSWYPNITLEQLLKIYRNHFPDIQLTPGAKEVLNFCLQNKINLGLITDGRSVTQRNKLKALGILDYFNHIVISEEIGSEKPSLKNFKVFMENAKPSTRFFYIGDNPKKDFIAPNQLGWISIGIRDKGKNIHSQDLSLSADYLPQIWLNDLIELPYILKP